MKNFYKPGHCMSLTRLYLYLIKYIADILIFIFSLRNRGDDNDTTTDVSQRNLKKRNPNSQKKSKNKMLSGVLLAKRDDKKNSNTNQDEPDSYEQYLSHKIYEHQLSHSKRSEGIKLAKNIKSARKSISQNHLFYMSLIKTLKSKGFIYSLRTFIIGFLLVLISQVSVLGHQKLLLKGRVISADGGTGISGATVQFENIITNTDENGYFTLSPPKASGILEITSVGYQKKKSSFIESSKDLIINLVPQISEIQQVEVVSTGYESLPKERATGSFTQISNELFNRRVSSNLMDRLEGVAAGLQFDTRNNASPTINIRGINTLQSGALGPLIVVDNFPYEGDLNNIDPNNVASVTLLKDAAASSIWGARAANGVIVITLKKPTIGSRTSVSFQTSTSLLEKPDLYYFPRMASTDFIDVEKMLYENGFYSSQLGANKKFYVISPVVTLLDKVDKGLISSQQANSNIDELRSLDYRDDMMRYIYRTGKSQRYYVNLSGSSAKHGYLFNVSYDKNDNTVVRSYNDRIQLRLSNTFKFSDKFELRNSISLNNSGTQSGGGAIYPINPSGGKTSLYPYAQLADDQGNPMAIPFAYNLEYVQGTGNGLLLDWQFKPIKDLSDITRRNNTRHMDVGLDLNYKPVEWLKFSLQYNLENQFGNGGTLYGEDSYYMHNIINRFSQISGGTVKRIVPLGASLVSSYSNMVSNRARAQGSFDRSFGDKHNLIAFLGAEISNRTTRSESSQVYGYDPNTLTSAYVDFLNTYPIYDGLASSGRISNSQSFVGGLRRFVSFFGNASYSYDKKYILSLSARKDASNSFGAKTNSRWNPLWSSGLAYALHEEEFIKNIKWIDKLKMRATLGFSGNSGGGNVKPLITYNSAPASFTNLTYAWLLAPPNPYLKWEIVRMINYGLDFSVLKGRLSGSLEYFRKKSMDLISDDPIDPTTGFSQITSNVAEIRGRGYDLQLNGVITNGVLGWSSTVALSHVKDVVTKYFGSELSSSNYVSSSGRSLNPREGKDFYGIYSYAFAGLDGTDGSPIGILNGERSKDYQSIFRDSVDKIIYHGSGLPPYYGFWRNSFQYKGIGLSFSLAFKFGAYFRKETINYSALYSSWETHGDYYKRWQKPGDEEFTTIPAMKYPADGNSDSFYAYSSANVLRSDLLRLQDIRLSYGWNSKGKLRMNMFTALQNMGILWSANKEGIDPDNVSLPRPRTYSFGLNANF